MAEDANAESLVETSDAGKLVRAESGLLPDLEVVTVGYGNQVQAHSLLRSRLTPLAGSSGAVEGVLLVSHDLTGSKVKVGDTTNVLKGRLGSLSPVRRGEEGLETSVGLVDPLLVGRGRGDERREESKGTHGARVYQPSRSVFREQRTTVVATRL